MITFAYIWMFFLGILQLMSAVIHVGRDEFDLVLWSLLVSGLTIVSGFAVLEMALAA